MLILALSIVVYVSPVSANTNDSQIDETTLVQSQALSESSSDQNLLDLLHNRLEMGEYHLWLGERLHLVKTLFARVRVSTAKFLRIQQSVAAGNLMQDTTDIGFEILVAAGGTVGLHTFFGVHENKSGHRRLHLGWGGRTSSPGIDSIDIGVVAGISHRHSVQGHGTASGPFRQFGGAFGVGTVYDHHFTDNSYLHREGVLIGAGLGYFGGNKSAYMRNVLFSILPMPSIFHLSTAKKIARLHVLQDRIVSAFHQLDLHRAEQLIQKFESDLDTLIDNLKGRWGQPVDFADLSLPAMHPFESFLSLYDASRVNPSRPRSFLFKLVKKCLRRV